MTPYYEDTQVKIYNGDCLEVMSELPSSSLDLVITSPPYNLGEGMEDKGGFRVSHAGSKWQGSRLRNGYESFSDNMPYPEYVEWQKKVLTECWRLLDDAGGIFYNHKPRIVKKQLRTPLALNPGLPLRQIVIWDRNSGFNYMDGAYMPMHEWILIFAKQQFSLRDKAASGMGDIWRFPAENGNPHPASFPLELPKRIISTTKAREVLDPFCGSGTTLRAAKDLGRKAIGIDISEAYCEIAAKRMSQEVLAFA